MITFSLLEKFKKEIRIVFFVFASAIAFPIYAASQPQNLHDLITLWVQFHIKEYIPILMLIAMVVFLAGVVRFVGAGDNEEKREGGRQVMIYGVIILFVMLCFWGFVGLLYGSFWPGQKVTTPDSLPQLLN